MIDEHSLDGLVTTRGVEKARMGRRYRHLFSLLVWDRSLGSGV